MHSSPSNPSRSSLAWTIFCQVIDNLGDIGVCWRLACNLAARGQQVQLWVDDPSALQWMAPAGYPGVSVQRWAADSVMPRPGDVVVEAFGCALTPEFIASIAHCACARAQKGLKQPVWINLEYLSAEPYVERNHRLPSPQPNGLTKHFFYPGFTPLTGGLLREPDLLARQAGFDRTAWLQAQGIAWQGEHLISLFCYEPPALGQLLAQLRAGPAPAQLLVTPGRAQQALAQALERLGTDLAAPSRLRITHLPYLSQPDFDHLLWACDFNFVRGEDSLVRALLAARPDALGVLQAVPFVWQVYPQSDNAHHAKLRAFLAWLQAPAATGAAHHSWSGLANAGAPCLPGNPAALAAAQHTATLVRARLLAQSDLAQQLMDFVQTLAAHK
ncbi:MAG: elongation factor P maturation arginine rhamnosyltransferase EarP [Burkholderiales bacterium]